MATAIRAAGPEDAAVIRELILALATLERKPDAVEVTAEELAAQLAQTEPPFEALLGEVDGEVVGFALFFHSYSTWRGRRGLYLEDLFVRPSHRSRGLGTQLMRELARIAVERGCARMEWAALDWNARAIALYEALGAVPLSEWTTYRLTDDALQRLARSAS